MYSYKTIKEVNGTVLAARNDGKYVVYSVDHKCGQVYSAMPGDQPLGGGRREFGSNNDLGIYYVTNGYSESYARKWFKKLTAGGN